MIIETHSPTSPATITIKIKNNLYQAIIDSGASGNYISLDLIEKMKLITSFMKSKKTLSSGDGSERPVDRETLLTFNIENLQSTIYSA